MSNPDLQLQPIALLGALLKKWLEPVSEEVLNDHSETTFIIFHYETKSRTLNTVY